MKIGDFAVIEPDKRSVGIELSHVARILLQKLVEELSFKGFR